MREHAEEVAQQPLQAPPPTLPVACAKPVRCSGVVCTLLCCCGVRASHSWRPPRWCQTWPEPLCSSQGGWGVDSPLLPIRRTPPRGRMPAGLHACPPAAAPRPLPTLAAAAMIWGGGGCVQGCTGYRVSVAVRKSFVPHAHPSGTTPTLGTSGTAMRMWSGRLPCVGSCMRRAGRPCGT